MNAEQWAQQTHVELPRASQIARWDLLVAGQDGPFGAESAETAIDRAKEALARWLGHSSAWLSPIVWAAASAERITGIPDRGGIVTPPWQALPELPTVPTSGGAPWRVRLEWRDPDRDGGSIAWPIWSSGFWGSLEWAPIAGSAQAVLWGAREPREATAAELERPTLPGRIGRAVGEGAAELGGELLASSGLGWLAGLAALAGLGALVVFARKR